MQTPKKERSGNLECGALAPLYLPQLTAASRQQAALLERRQAAALQISRHIERASR